MRHLAQTTSGGGAMTVLRQVLGAAGWLVVVFLAAWVGARFLPDDWYRNLTKPSWNPPNWLFAPVWTLLYILMALAAWLVWRRFGFRGAFGPLSLFAVQLALNAAWTWLFFGRHRPDLALVEIVVFWVVLVTTIFAFWRLLPLAGVILLPYLAWVTFASFLNLTIWRLNR
jgi:tryptophan-rich sensory protein